MDNYYGNICYCRRCNGVVHTIKKGDTLYLISKYYKVPIGEIMGANRNINIYNLQVGDEICIPVRRPEPRESDVNDTLINNMSRSIGNTMNNNNPMGENNMYDDVTNMTSYERMTGQSDTSADRMTNYMDDNVNNNMDNEVIAASSQASDINALKISELIGEKDMTVEELAQMLKKYM